MTPRLSKDGICADNPTVPLVPAHRATEELPTQPIRISPRHTDRAGSPFAITIASRGQAEPEVPGYRIVGRLGRGGMGVVYKAVHLALNRPVALKMLGGTSFEIDPEVRARFRKEAEALASLRHPNIVPVFEVGEAEGLPYFTMELVDGGDLSTRILNHSPGPIEAARVAAQLARGVQAAHEAGILHRDLKPSNILLSTIGESDSKVAAESCPLSAVPKIADFGLAKRFGAGRGNDRTVTQAGDILGTPSYMAPEQAEGNGSGIGPGTDIYALGAILYEMLANRPPFESDDPVKTVIQVLNDEPVAPGKLVTGISRDLETICLKCLQKDAKKRYLTAGALADDLDRFVAGRPIVARPVSAPERAYKWARRRPGTAAMLATTAIAIFSALFGTTTMWLRANDRAAREEAAHGLAESRGKELQRKAVEIETRLALSYIEQGQAACREGDVGRGLVLMSEALVRIDALRPRAGDQVDGDRLDHLEWITRTNLSRWAPRLPLRRRANFKTPRSHDQCWVTDVDLSPDGQTAMTVSLDGYIRLFNAETNVEIGEPLHLEKGLTQAAFSPDGKRFLTTLVEANPAKDAEPRVQIWDTASRSRIGPPIPLGEVAVQVRIFAEPLTLGFVGFISAESFAVQADDRTIRVYQTETATATGPAIHADIPITQAAPADGGKTLFTGHVDGSVRKWDVATGRELARTDAGETFVSTLSVRPDGSRVLSGRWDGWVSQWDARTLESVGGAVVPSPGEGPNAFACLFAAEYTPDGTGFVCAGGRWSPQKKQRAGLLVMCDAESGEQRFEFPVLDPIWSVAFAAGGETLIAAEESCRIRIFSAQDGATLHVYHQSGNPYKVAVGRDGRTILAAERGTEASPLLADLAPPLLRGSIVRFPADSRGIAFTPDSSGLRVLTKDGFLRTYDVRSGQLIGAPIQATAGMSTFKASTDGRRGATWTDPRDGSIPFQLDLWDLDRLTVSASNKLDRWHHVEFFPNGSGLFAIPSEQRDVRLINPDGSERWHRNTGLGWTHNHPYVAAISADQQTVITGPKHGRRLAFLSARTGEPVQGNWELPNRLYNLLAHPDGRSLILVFDDGYLRSFDLATRRPNGPAISWKGKEVQTRLSPDGRDLMIRTEENESSSIALVDIKTGLPLGPTFTSLRFGTTQFNNDGTLLAIADHRSARCWEIPGPMIGPVEQVRCWAEAAARLEFVAEPTETLTHLDDRAVGERRKRLREVWGGEPLPAAVRTNRP